MIIELSTILTLAGAVITVGTAWMTIRKINKDLKKERELEAAKILQEAKEATDRVQLELETKNEAAFLELENKIGQVKKEVDNFKQNVDKDLQHIRETYNGEIRNLGQKIEELRSELRNQHGQLVGLLTKMIDSKD